MQLFNAGPTARFMRVCIALACACAALPITPLLQAFASTVPATVGLTMPASVPLGTAFSFSLDFANVGLTTGYGPYINLFLPAAGADGDDGITFISADVLGNSIAAIPLACPAGSTVTSPLTNLPISCPAAPAGTNQLLILQLPFGSVAPAQSTSPINIVAQLSNLADMAVPLSIAAQAGFVTGSTPDNFEPSQGVLAAATVQPSLFDLQKAANELESETSTGPNFPRSYTLTPRMPAGITATNVIITDTVPPDIVLISVSGATLIAGPAIPGGPYTAPANSLVFNYGSLVGTGAPIVIQYYVTQTNALNQAVLDPLTGAPASRTNTVVAAGIWTPIDPRDPAGPISGSATRGSINRALALQKQVTQIAPPSHPGEFVTYTLNFQVSDFFSLGNLLITDTLSDGQEFVAGSATFAVTDRTGSVSGAVPPTTLITASLGAAGTQVQFDVSSALVALGAADGVLQGGHTFAPASPTAATGSLTYLARIADNYFGNAPLQPADVLSNTALIAGDVLSNTNLASPATARISDTSTAAFTLSGPTLSKTIVAIDGNPTLPSPLMLSPGDVVTFRLVYNLDTGDFNNFTLTDVLPLPLFDATALTTFISTTAGLPAAGVAHWGSGMSAGDLSRVPAPALTSSATDNSVRFAFPNQTDPTNTATHIELLLSAQVANEPFADGLTLVNRVNSIQTNSAGQSVVRSAQQAFPAAAPKVRLSKGVIGTNNLNATLTAAAGPVPFAPTSALACSSRFTGTLNTTGLQTTPINANLSNADAADTVRMAIVVENIGAARDGAYDVAVADSLPAGMSYAPGTLCVQSGNGTALPYTGLDTALFTTGITLSAPLSQGLSYAGVPTTTGNNLALLSFDVVLSNTVTPGQTITNQASLRHFAAQPGASNFVPVQGPGLPVVDVATVGIAPFSQHKQLIGTEISATINSLLQAVAGELITYTLLVTVPEGVANNVRITDTLPAGLAFVGCDSILASPSLISSIGFVPGNVCGTNGTGTTAFFNFGTLTNTNTNNAVVETITLTYAAVALNVGSNVTGTALINNAQLNWFGNGGAPVTSSAAPVTFIEPRLLASKSSNAAFGDAFDQITFSIVVTNPASNSTALYDAVLTDVVPNGMVLNAASVTAASGPTPILTVTTPSFIATWPALLPGETSVITFQVTISPAVVAGQHITNTAFAYGSSLPGAPGTRGPNPNAAERSYSATNASSVFIVSPPQSHKFLLATEISTTANTRTQVVIGELVTYTLVITVPEGVTPGVQVIDTLDNGLAFVSFDGIAASADLQFAQPIASYLTPTVSAVGASPGRRATWLFGAITNTNSSNAVAETLQITYTAIVLNMANNVQAQIRNNSALLSWSTGVLAAAQATNIQVIEPVIGLTKSVSPLTGDRGDVVTYTLVLTGPAHTDAFEVLLSDALPFTAALGTSLILSPSLVSVNSNTTPVLGLGDFGLTGSNATGFTLTSSSAIDLPLDVTRRITVVLTGTLPVVGLPGSQITNTALAGWTSLDGFAQPITRSLYNTNSVERIYSATGIAALTIPPLQASKSIITTSEDFTGVGLDGLLRVAIGERVEYRLAVQVPEAGSPDLNVNLLDQLPAGLSFITNTAHVAFVANGAGFASTVITPGLPGCATLDVPGNSDSGTPASLITCPFPTSQITIDAFGRPRFNFGNLLNDDDDGDAEFVIVQFNARVVNTPTNQIGTQLTNTFDVQMNGVTADASAPVTVTVAEPALQVSKWVAVARSPVGADDVLTYTLRLTNTGTTTAFDINLTDTLPLSVSFLATQQITITSGISTGVLITDANVLGSSALAWQFSALAAGSAAEVIFTAQAGNALGPNLTLRNTAAATSSGLSGPSPFERSYTSAVAIADVNTAGAAIDFSKTTLQTSLAPGELLTYTLRVTNTSIAAANGLVVTDRVPANTSFVSVAPTSLATTANSVVTWTVGNMAANSVAVLTLTVRADEPLFNGTLITNTAHLTATTATQASAILTPSSSVTSSIISSHTLALAKTVQPSVAAPGDIVTYTLAYTASGNAPATNLLLSDTLPVSLTFLSSNPLPSAQQGSTLTWTLGTLSPTLSAPAIGFITFTAQVSTASVPNGVQWLNTADLRDDVSGPVFAQASLTIATAHTFAISKAADPTIATAGEPLTYTIAYTLTGSEAAQAAVVTDALPSGTSFVSCAGGLSCNLIGGVPTWSLGNLNPPATGVLTVVVNVSSAAPLAGTLTNTVRVSDTNAGVPASAVLATLVQHRADLAISKVASPAPVVAGGLLTYTLRYTNTGPSDAGSIVISDTLPASVTLVSATPSPTSQVGQLLRWQVSALPLNTSAQINIVVAVASLPNIPPISNTATITSSAADPNSIDNTASATTSVTYADVFVQKTVTPTLPVRPGDTLTWTVTYGNIGNAPAVNVAITDTLPTASQFGGIISQTAGLMGPMGAPPVLRWLLPILVPGQTGQIVLTMTSQTQSGISNVLLNRVDIGTTTPQTQTANDTANTMNPPMQLAVAKTAGRAGVHAGQSISFTLSVTNTGAVDLLQIPLTDTFDTTYLQYVTAAPLPSTIAPSRLVWQDVGPLSPGINTRVVVTFTALQTTSGLSTTNFATATGTYTGVSPLVVGTQAQLLILPPTSHTLQLSQQATPSPALAGDVLTYTLFYTVAGDEPALGVVLADTLPAGVTLISCDGCDSSAGAGQLRWLLGDVNPPASGTPATGTPASGTRTITVRVSPDLPNGSVLLNTARISDTTTTSVSAAVTTTVNAGADIGISKAAQTSTGNTTVRSGSLVTYTLTVTNYGPSDIAALLPMAVPGNPGNTIGPAATYPMIITINDADNGAFGALITDLTVTLSAVSHGYAADLDVLLVGPNGQVVMLMSDAGSIKDISNATLRFHDGAPLPPDDNRVLSGLYAPSDYIGNDGVETLPAPAPRRPFADRLAAFKGIPAKGEWQLYVFDDQATDVGSIAQGWMLTLATDQGNRTYTSQTAMRVEDTLPPGSTVVDGTPGFGGPNPLVWLDGILAGETRTYTVTTRLNYAGQLQIQNTASVSMPLPDSNPANNTSRVNLGVEYASVNVITLTQIPTLTPGGTTFITIPLINTGNVTSTGLIITVTLPWWLDFTNPPPSWVEVAPGVWVILIAALAPGSNGELVLPIEVPAIFPPGVTDAEIIITIGGPGNAAPVPVVIEVPVDTRPRLVFAKSASPPSGSSLYIGDHITYTLAVTNSGPLTLSQLILADAVPASTAYIQGSATPSTQPDAGVLQWTIEVLPPQTTVTFTFAVMLYRTSPTTYPITNTATLQNAGFSATASNAVQHVYLPDAVRLTEFTIEPLDSKGVSGTGLRIRWVSMLEVNTFGFALYRSTTGHRAEAVLVTPELLPAQGAGARYEVVDKTALVDQPNVYWLQEIETTGRVNEYGPYTMRRAGQALEQPAQALPLYLPVVVR